MDRMHRIFLHLVYSVNSVRSFEQRRIFQMHLPVNLFLLGFGSAIHGGQHVEQQLLLFLVSFRNVGATGSRVRVGTAIVPMRAIPVRKLGKLIGHFLFHGCAGSHGNGTTHDTRGGISIRRDHGFSCATAGQQQERQRYGGENYDSSFHKFKDLQFFLPRLPKGGEGLGRGGTISIPSLRLSPRLGGERVSVW